MTLFDPNVALKNVGGDHQALRSVSGVFFGEQAQLVRAIDEAIEQSDAKLLERSAHTLKSSLRTLGGEKVAKFAMELEQKGGSGDLENTRELVHGLREHLQQYCAEFKRFVESQSG